MSHKLVVQFAKRFIQRRDIKAIQHPTGSYTPDRQNGFMAADIENHLSGKSTYGHYLLDNNDQCRMFAFDIDLEKTGFYIDMPPYNTLSENITEAEFQKLHSPIACNPREIWSNRQNLAARNWYKYQMSMLARKFCSTIIEQLNIPCAAAYSGNKGIHVYGFLDPMPAEEVREAALLVLDAMDDWTLLRGKNFFQHKIKDPEIGFPSFSLEVFPKQISLDGKDLGNLLRLPLGRNLKSNDPTFFIDFNSPITELKPHSDPAELLETGNPFL